MALPRKGERSLAQRLATRGMIAALPVAMVAAYSTNVVVPPPRMTAAEYQMVAEINVSPTTIGIAASPLYGQSYDSVKQQLQDMKNIGVTNIRVFVPWATIEFFGPQDPSTWPGTQLWSDMDNIMRAAKELDMGMLAEVNSTPPYAAINGGAGSGTPDPAAFATFLTKFIGKYGDVVSAYEVWNEPNYAAFSNPIDPEAYAGLLAAAAKVIRQYDSTASIVAGAVGTVQDGPFTMNTITWVNRMLAKLQTISATDPTITNFFDALSIHPYGEEIPFSGTCPTCVPGLLTPREQFEALAALAALQGKKIWITEYGLPTTPGGPWTQADQSAWIKDLLDTWQKYGDPTSSMYNANIAKMLGPIFLYTGRDTPGLSGGVNNPHDYYGLWDVNGNLKSAGQMLKDWITAHQNPPTNPGGPTQPPVDPVAQWFQQLAQQLAQALAQAIANWLASLAQPQAATPAAAATTLRIASVEAPAAETAVEAEVKADAGAVDAATEAAAADPEAAKLVVHEEVVAETPAAAPVEPAPAEAAPATETTPAEPSAPPSQTESTPPASSGGTESSSGTDTKDTDTKGSDTKGSDTKGSDTKGEAAGTTSDDTKPDKSDKDTADEKNAASGSDTTAASANPGGKLRQPRHRGGHGFGVAPARAKLANAAAKGGAASSASSDSHSSGSGG
jgi:hypothetical protein